MPGAVILEYYNVNVGVFSYTDDRISLVPVDVPEKVVETYRQALNTRVVKASIVGTPLLGIFIAGNNNGVILPYTVSPKEYEFFSQLFGNVAVLPSKMTAVGNIVLANDYAALIHPELSDEAARVIRETLEVEVYRGTIAGIPTVGSVAVVTNRGLLVTPNASEEELRFLEKIFNVEGDTGTVNRGGVYVKVGIVCNSYGAVVGRDTTGIELANIERALGIMEEVRGGGRGEDVSG